MNDSGLVAEMLHELVVNNLGVIRTASVVFDEGMSAFTGETGAGKTLLVEAIELLLGGKAEGVFVGPNGSEARVDGRFIVEDSEVVLSRVVPRSGRSRAYIDGHPVSVSALGERGSELLDLHGQHAHQRLLAPSAQRDALDLAAGISTSALHDLRSQRKALEIQREGLGGDERARAREIDLLTYQLEELRAARIAGPDEDTQLAEEEEVLSNAQLHRDALETAVEALASDSGILTLLGVVRHALAKPYFDSVALRVKNAATEIDDIASDLRRHLSNVEDDPQRRSELRERRQVLRQLRRKYGDTLEAVLAFAATAEHRLDELQSHDERASTLENEIRALVLRERTERDRLADLRRGAAPAFCANVLHHLKRLALPNATFSVEVSADDADEQGRIGDSKVTFLFAANPGLPAAPVSKVASGGELARVMLALQLAMVGAPGAEHAPSVLVFDEVDAGIGGETALSVGDALAELGARHQVLVVTHLAQVAASADVQIHVHKDVEPSASGDPITVTTVTRLSENERVGEVARMLAGDPASPSALRHAQDLLAARRSARSINTDTVKMPQQAKTGSAKAKKR